MKLSLLFESMFDTFAHIHFNNVFGVCRLRAANLVDNDAFDGVTLTR